MSEPKILFSLRMSPAMYEDVEKFSRRRELSNNAYIVLALSRVLANEREKETA